MTHEAAADRGSLGFLRMNGIARGDQQEHAAYQDAAQCGTTTGSR